jgi:hypothetical protein
MLRAYIITAQRPDFDPVLRRGAFLAQVLALGGG